MTIGSIAATDVCNGLFVLFLADSVGKVGKIISYGISEGYAVKLRLVWLSLEGYVFPPTTNSHTLKNTAKQRMLCDLCGNDHATEKCQMLLLHHPSGSTTDTDEEVHLAYKSLPPWAEVKKERNGKTSVITNKKLPKFTRLGPLIAPQKPCLVPNDCFPLKISYNASSSVYFDLSNKQYCNWLSLIQRGSSDDRNLLVCQIDDHLFYVSSKDIEEKTELRVWYAPFYLEKVADELNSLRSSKRSKSVPQSKDSLTSVKSRSRKTRERDYTVPATLEKISIGKGSMTFTHKICHNGEVAELSGVSASRHPARSSWDGFIEASGVSCRYVHKDQMSERSSPVRKSAESVESSVNDLAPTIEMVNDAEAIKEADRVVTFTIHAATRSQLSSHSQGHRLLSGDVDDTARTKLLDAKKKPYKRKRHKSVMSADASVVKQLPPRALGARLPRPWSCRYCGETFSKPLPFAQHLKSHLLSSIGGRFKCELCGQSFATSSSLKVHKTVIHKYQIKVPSPIEDKGETEVVIKHEILSDEDELGEDSGSEGNIQLSEKVVPNLVDISKGPHDCQLCTKKFHKAEYLLRHLRKHTGDFACQKCFKVFARREGLQKHTCPNQPHQERLECSLCNRLFFSKTLLQQHYLKHEGSKKCTRCGRFFSNMQSLEKHIKGCPLVEISTSFQCTVCSKEFARQPLLARHAKIHKRKHRCKICSKTYTSSTNFQQHTQHCRQVQEIITMGHVKCEECRKVFTDAADFTSHYQRHTHPFSCNGCRHRFKTRIGYEVHVCQVELQCDQCSAVFKSVQGLNRHAAVHGPPPFTCMSCRRSYYRKESLDRHSCPIEEEMKNNPQPKGNTNFKCNVCGVILATRHSYNTHIRTAHGGAAGKIFSCELCGKQFSRKDLLQQHSLVHAPPSHPCPHCKKLFKTPKSLEVHSLLHLGIKRFACKYCNKKYHQKINLERHERSHMPRGAVKCQYCACQCLSTDDLKAHLLSHTVPQPDVSQKSHKITDVETKRESLVVSLSQVCHLTEGESSQERLETKLPPCTDGKPELKATPETAQRIRTGEVFSLPQGSMLSNITHESHINSVCLGGPNDKDAQNMVFQNKTCVISDLDKGKDSSSCQDSNFQSYDGSNSSVFVPLKATNNSTSERVPVARESVSEEQPYTLMSDKHVCVTTFPSSKTVNSDLCGTVNVEPADSSDLMVESSSHIYHLNLDDDNCQVTIEKRNEDFDLDSCDQFEEQNYKDIPDSIKSTSSVEGQGMPVVYDSSNVVVMANTEGDVRF